jgi:hypothetical protein
MTRRAVDLATVRDVRRRLAEIAREHPQALAPERVAQIDEDTLTMTTKVLSLRLNEDILALVEQARQAVAEQNPGLQVSTPDTVRMLILEALQARGIAARPGGGKAAGTRRRTRP